MSGLSLMQLLEYGLGVRVQIDLLLLSTAYTPIYPLVSSPGNWGLQANVLTQDHTHQDMREKERSSD